MTGFGAATAGNEELSVRVEVRTVNHRHLQIKQRLAPEASHLEGDLEGMVRKRLARGSVSLGLQVQRGGGAAAACIDLEVARAYRERLTELARELGLEGDLELADLLDLPGVVAGREEGDADPRLRKLTLQALKDALDELLGMREEEGRALARDLERQATAVGKLCARIAKRMPTVVRAHQRTLQQRVEELVGRGAEIPPKDLAREISILADRLDVSEELTRLEAHLAQVAKLLAKGGAIGRKLDFLTQELFREANTVGSKCSDAKVAHAVVDLKTHIERLREQVQNVE